MQVVRVSPCSSLAPRVPVSKVARTLARNGRRRSLPVCKLFPDDTPDKQLGPIRRVHEVIQRKQVVGSEYGEGFVQFRIGADPVRLDVDTLNENLKHKGAMRLRHTLRPDEAFGMVFNFEGVVADTRTVLNRSWQLLAASKGLPFPELVRIPTYNTCPERVIMDVLGWTRDLKSARALSWELAQLYSDQLTTITEPIAGIRDWLNALTNFNVPCALVSQFDKATVRRTLERMHLHDHFSVMVTAEDDMETISQRYLSAAMQLQRPPNQCVVFSDSPEGITAAHNCTMKSVAVTSWFPAYQLQQADLACASLEKLTVYNVRRLFANCGDEFMDMKKQYNGDQEKFNKRRVRNAVADN